MAGESLGFSEILTKLEEQKADLLSQIDRWPLEKLNHRPTSADWSVLEMLDHLVKTESAILSAARTGLANPHRIGIDDKLRTAFLQKVFASDRKVKVPASAGVVLPGSALQLEEIRQRWNDSREELKSFVSQADCKLLSEGIFRHPVGGWMGMRQILEFFSVHLIHHGYQLNRLGRTAPTTESRR
jgi:uncharacterized damage-inducible protein DinB